MQILPVLDLRRGLIVRGYRGERSSYRPLASPLVRDANPRTVAEAFRRHFDLTTLYLADLDAIAGQEPAFPLFEQLATSGFELWVDAGLREARQAQRLLAAGVTTVIVGLETIPGPELLHALLPLRDKILISLDLKGGQPLTPYPRWQTTAPEAIAQEIIDMGYLRMLLLDVARVGTGEGTGTDDLCRRLLAKAGGIQLFAGGGIRSRQDLNRLHDLGVVGVLVASALHDGTITREDLAIVP